MDGADDRLERLRLECLWGARILWHELHDPFGHVTARLPDGGGFLMKTVRVPPEAGVPDEVIAFDAEGRLTQGRQRVSETPLHTEILRLRTDVGSVVHAHPHTATALSAVDRTVFAITQQASRFGAGLPLFKGDLLDTTELGVEVAQALGSAPAILLRGHGVISVGRNVGEAVETMLYVEQAARQIVAASAVGEPQVLPERLRSHRAHTGAPVLHMWKQLLWSYGFETEPGS